MAIDLSIIIPTYNEERRLLKTLKAYTSFFDHRLSCEYIVTDQSRDNTRQIVRHFMKRHKNVHLLCLTGRGKGGAVLEAFKISTGKFIGFTDADNSTSPQEFYKLYKNMDGYDAVIGSRGLSRSKVVHYHQPHLRRLGSFILGVVFVRILFGLKIKATQCGAKIFRREPLLMIIKDMRIRNSIFDIELLWRFSRVGSIKELPITWVDDKFSNFRWHEVFGEFIWLIRVRLGI